VIQSPTWIPGIYHFSNTGIISWYDFAIEIKRQTGAECAVHPITSDQFPTPAKRPKYSVMDCSKVSIDYGVPLSEWKDSLARCISLLKEIE
jgi:dTDP-4-dehydrorhamnose reductase